MRLEFVNPIEATLRTTHSTTHGAGSSPAGAGSAQPSSPSLRSPRHSSAAALLLVLLLGAGGLSGCGAHTSGGPGGGGAPDRSKSEVSILQLQLPLAPDGTYQRLTTHSGRPLVLYFFSTWCVPCIEDITLLNGIHQRYALDGLQVAAVATDLEGMVTINPYIEHMGVNFPVYGASTELVNGHTTLGALPSLPFTLFINHKGETVAGHMGELPAGEALEDAVRGLMRMGGLPK